VHLRKSNTEPIIRVIAEARDEESARRLVDRALTLSAEAAEA
jgi:phosphomannomutase